MKDTFVGQYNIIAGIATLDWKQTWDGMKQTVLTAVTSIGQLITTLGTVLIRCR